MHDVIRRKVKTFLQLIALREKRRTSKNKVVGSKFSSMSFIIQFALEDHSVYEGGLLILFSVKRPGHFSSADISSLQQNEMHFVLCKLMLCQVERCLHVKGQEHSNILLLLFSSDIYYTLLHCPNPSATGCIHDDPEFTTENLQKNLTTLEKLIQNQVDYQDLSTAS